MMSDPETNRPEITIEKLVYGGQGLARLDGGVALVPFVLPGERLRVEIKTERRGLLSANPVEILTPAAARVEPPCPVFVRCGGCHYQHAQYETQLDQKREILRETLARIGKLQAPEEIRVVAGEPWGYRNRTQFHLANGRIGFFGFGSHQLVAVNRCPISSPKINEALAALESMAGERRFPRFVESIELFTNESQVQLNVLETRQPVARQFFDWCAERIGGYTDGAIEYSAGSFVYRVRHRSFFQVNRFLAGPMVDVVLEAAGDGQSALDLYAGVGLFSVPLAQRFRSVTAVESNASAVGDLEYNAERAGVAVQVHRQRVEMFLESAAEAPDAVIADPPRAGLGAAAVRQLLRLKPPRLVIVSCDPATLARDLRALLAGGYGIERLTLIDLFPQTFHIETVTCLALR
jgi:23S rRNA (uracil1939-C5)-methyltransferase